MSNPISTARPDTSAVSALLRRYAWFEGEPPATPPPATPPPATPPAPNGGNNGEDDEQPIMSSAKLKERLERDREAQRKKIYTDLGIEDPDADKELLAAARKRKADEQSAADKAVEALAKETAKREKAEQELADHLAKTAAKEREAASTSAVTKALKAAGAVSKDEGNPNAKAEKVLKLLRADHAADLDAVLKDDGTVDEKKVTALVDVARKSYPEDFGKGGVGSPGLGGGRATQPGADTEKHASRLNQSRIRG